MELEVFGIGAAGNKAAIKAIERNVVSKEYVKLFNTTTKDIPTEYKNDDIVVPFASSILGGCGKEPKKGRKAIQDAMNSGSVNIAEMIHSTTKEVVLVTSTEGGSGCGATPYIAKTLIALNIPVHVFAFVGFQEDFRSIKNTLLFFSSMDDSVILHVIKNSEFLDYTNDFQSAERLANEEFVNQLKTLSANLMPSEQNMDDKDIYKATATSGYMDIKNISLSGVKNEEMFNKAIIDAYTNNKGFDFDPTAKRVAVIINASDKTKLAIDNTFNVLFKYTGDPKITGEFFKHIQYDPEEPEYISVIASGIRIPDKEFVKINNKFEEIKSKRENNNVSYSTVFSGLQLDDDDEDDLDMDVRTMNNPDNVNKFFKDKVKVNTPLQNVKVDNNGVDSIENY